MKTIKELAEAWSNKKKLIWKDPEPIKGNDYTISFIGDLTDLSDDSPILIQYNNGKSETEVYLHEIQLIDLIIKVTQCDIGQYNLLSNEKSLSFYMSIFNKEDNTVYEENDIKAQLHYSGEPYEVDIFRDAINNIEEVFTMCFKYAKNVMSSIDYKAQCLLFYKVYQANFENIESNMRNERDKRIKKQIERLQKELTYDILYDLQYCYNNIIDNEISLLKKYIESINKQNMELKEDSHTFAKNIERIRNYQAKIEDYENKRT